MSSSNRPRRTRNLVGLSHVGVGRDPEEPDPHDSGRPCLRTRGTLTRADLTHLPLPDGTEVRVIDRSKGIWKPLVPGRHPERRQQSAGSLRGPARRRWAVSLLVPGRKRRGRQPQAAPGVQARPPDHPAANTQARALRHARTGVRGRRSARPAGVSAGSRRERPLPAERPPRGRPAAPVRRARRPPTPAPGGVSRARHPRLQHPLHGLLPGARAATGRRPHHRGRRRRGRTCCGSPRIVEGCFTRLPGWGPRSARS